ncbi:MAG: hypothetical protein ACI9TB_001735 [Parasphingorhabdus sp.]|jgi:hypothetical protein|uniref:hypothetical protein n=1 Tax=Parasphingorhabdus sp. TaxID=2709688 RepID=UPI0039E65C13|tara:strand:- start:719 stop:1219 length:501 start_codon:yes stop_codon:yes gene_type:complete
MATTIAATPTTMDAYIEKQARGDAVVNIVLAGGINYWLTRDLAFVPGTLPLGDTDPSLGGTLVGIAVLMSILLTLIVYAITVSQRKSGKIMPGLSADTRVGFAPYLLALKHLALTLIPAVLIGMVLQGAAPDLRFSPLVFTAIVTIIAAVLAYFMSKSTTRATLKL